MARAGEAKKLAVQDDAANEAEVVTQARKDDAPEKRVAALIDRDPFLSALSLASAIVETRNTIPILSHILLECDGAGWLRLSASDLDMQAVLRVAADGPPFAMAVPAQRLAQMIGKFEAGSVVVLEPIANALIVRSGRSKMILPTLPRDDFPVIAIGALGVEVESSGTEFVTPLARCAYAISDEEHRYYLCGVFATAQAGPFRMAATNGHILCEVMIGGAGGSAADWAGWADMILPRKLVNLLSRHAADAPHMLIRQSQDATKIVVEWGDICITSKVIDGAFPDYARVIPAPAAQILRIDPEMLGGAVGRAALIGDGKERKVVLDLDEGCCTVRNFADAGQYEEQVPADWGGEPTRSGFNGRYLRDTLAVFDGESVELSQADPRSPALMTSAAAPAVRAVIMPMAV